MQLKRHDNGVVTWHHVTPDDEVDPIPAYAWAYGATHVDRIERTTAIAPVPPAADVDDVDWIVHEAVR